MRKITIPQIVVGWDYIDYIAYFDGEEEAGNYGRGKTEAEAILDFFDNYAVDHLERLGIIPTDTA